MTKSTFLLSAWGSKRKIFDRKYPKSFFRIVLPTVARSTFLKTCGAKSELDHKNHERDILRLAFLMQIRNKVCGDKFFAARSAHAEQNENTNKKHIGTK